MYDTPLDRSKLDLQFGVWFDPIGSIGSTKLKKNWFPMLSNGKIAHWNIWTRVYIFRDFEWFYHLSERSWQDLQFGTYFEPIRPLLRKKSKKIKKKFFFNLLNFNRLGMKRVAGRGLKFFLVIHLGVLYQTLVSFLKVHAYFIFLPLTARRRRAGANFFFRRAAADNRPGSLDQTSF